MPGPRPLARQDLAGHLVWLRTAVHDRQMAPRLILEGLLDALEAVVDLLPGPPSEPGPPG
jgi:hypothetical protein